MRAQDFGKTEARTKMLIRKLDDTVLENMTTKHRYTRNETEGKRDWQLERHASTAFTDLGSANP
eukprot:1154925-Pelagomonas_calceolata.AAC.10